MKAYDINWDTDGEKVELPTEMEIPKGLEGEKLTEYLSEQTGFFVCDYKVSIYSPKEVRMYILEYVCFMLSQHDMSVCRNQRYANLAREIANCCISKILPILPEFNHDNQIRYFVRQTMLYMMLEMMEEREK